MKTSWEKPLNCELDSSKVHPIPLTSSYNAESAESMKDRIYTRIRSDLERIEAEIDRHLHSTIPFISVVSRYIVGSGGKRLRPLLMVLCARLCGNRSNKDTALSVVFEFVHAASLLHDDVVDHAEVRRNQPAANTVWGNPAVVLVGDFLYSKAINLAVSHNNIHILEVLTRATTLMAEGEVLQLINADNLEVGEEEYLEIIKRKTAVLISAACQIGAIFGGGSHDEEQALRHYGHHLGIAFQLIDDTLDYTGEIEELGKPIGNDIKEGKATLPLIHTFQNCAEDDRHRLKEIFSADEISRVDFLKVKSIVTGCGGLDYTYQSALKHVNAAKEALEVFPGHPTKVILQDIADFVICRRT